MIDIKTTLPIPTDNVFKLLALLGLFFYSFSHYYGKTTVHEFKLAEQAQTEIFQKVNEMSPSTKRTNLRNNLLAKDHLAADKLSADAVTYFLMAVLGGLALLVGSWQWIFRIQPRLDRKVELENVKLELEVINLKDERVIAKPTFWARLVSLFWTK